MNEKHPRPNDQEELPPRVEADNESRERIKAAVTSHFTVDNPTRDRSETIRAAEALYLEELAEISTDPRIRYSPSETEQVGSILSGKKIPENKIMPGWKNLLFLVGQSFRLTPDEIDGISEKYFSSIIN